MRGYYADVVRRFYEAWLKGVVGLFAVALEAPNPTTPQVRGDFTAAAAKLAKAMLEDIEGTMTEASERLMVTLPADDSYRAVVQEGMLAFVERARTQAQRDILTAAASLRKLALEIELGSQAENFTTALLRAKRGRVTQLKFQYTDRANRRWASPQFIAVAAREFLVAADIDLALRAIRPTSDLARLVYPEADHEHHGLVFSISGASTVHPSFAELVERGLFHPNTFVSVEAA